MKKVRATRPDLAAPLEQLQTSRQRAVLDCPRSSGFPIPAGADCE